MHTYTARVSARMPPLFLRTALRALRCGATRALAASRQPHAASLSTEVSSKARARTACAQHGC